ncbi:MBL fold metallo-hydrolase [uncultured Propionivibrio sp.]|uniref:MBL fold metallo-hydrolase n=1 Tax=uncultured Propionivibrio sp. TaxID=426737 RepID=UPI0029C04CDD|nr:MBL fold metallo-hydrolase [uncultured Propionivibrio sp.]
MRFASLGSGSRGNALVVDSGRTRVLVDCGFSGRSMLERLGRLGLEAASIDALLVTHEHSDHVSGVVRFASRFGIPVVLTHGTFAALGELPAAAPVFRLVDSHAAFALGDLEILPYPVPHDAREPVQFVFSDGAARLGVLTDCGRITPHVVEVLGRCDALVLECNHDPELLSASSYPPMLKRRIAGNFGHLDNAQAAGLLAQVDQRRLQHVIAAHLSEENNRPELACQALAEALGCAADWVAVASQEEGFGWRQLA